MDHVQSPEVAAPVVTEAKRQPGQSEGPSRLPLIQAKLSVGPAGDQYEQEADRVAAAVMRNIREASSSEHVRISSESNDRVQSMRRGDRSEIPADSDLRGAHGGGVRGRVQAKSAVAVVRSLDSAVRLPRVSQVQAKAVTPTIGVEGGALDADTDSRIRRATGSGKPLEDGVRRSMEGGFGADFSAVRVHDNAGADDLNQRIQAKAFTTGSDIFFRQGEYKPTSPAGQELLAHELTHTIQQTGGGDPTRAQRDVIQRNKYGLLEEVDGGGAPGPDLAPEEDDEPLAEMDFGDDQTLQISPNSVAFGFEGHTLTFEFDPDKGTAGAAFSHVFSVPDDGPDSEWASIPLLYPIVPGIWLKGSIGIGGGAKFTVAGNAKVKNDPAMSPPYSGSIDSKNTADASLFVFAKLGVSAGVPGIAEVEGGVKSQVGPNTSANLDIDVNDIVYQENRWTTAGGFRLGFKLNETDITGTIKLYIEAKVLGGLLSKSKEVELANKTFGTFGGVTFNETIGEGGNKSIDRAALAESLKNGDRLEEENASAQPVIDLMTAMFRLPELKDYKTASKAATKAKATFLKKIGKKTQDALDAATAARNQQLGQLAEKLQDAGNIAKLVEHATKMKSKGVQYYELGAAGEIGDDLATIGTDITTLIGALESVFDLTGEALAKAMTPANAQKIIGVLNSVNALDINVRMRDSF